MRRRDRWLTVADVVKILAERYPELLKLKPHARRQRVYRTVRHAERRDGETYSRRVGGLIVVSRNALESLLPFDARVVANLEQGVADLAQKHRALKKQVNGHGSRLRLVEKRCGIHTRYLSELAELDGREA